MTKRLISLSLLAAGGGFAQSATKPADAASTVFVDPVTRQIRQPEPGEMGTLLGPPGVKPVRRVVRGPGTAVGVMLDDSFMTSMMVTRNADGKLSVECVTKKD